MPRCRPVPRKRRCIFEVFGRRLPEGRAYMVNAGIGRLLDLIADFTVRPRRAEHLAARGIVSPPTLDWLAGYRFTGDIDGYAEGELFFPGSPLLTLTADFATGVVLETLILSVLNHDVAVASAASRMWVQADGTAPDRDGVPPDPRGGRGRRRPRRVDRRVLRDEQRRGGPPLRDPVGRDRRARVHPAARQRAGGVRRPGGRAGRGHHAAGRHLRHARGCPATPLPSPARGSVRSGSTPATSASWPARRAHSWMLPVRPAPGSWRPPTSMSTRSPSCRRARGRLRRRDLGGHGVGIARGGSGVQGGRGRRPAGGQVLSEREGQHRGAQAGRRA